MRTSPRPPDVVETRSGVRRRLEGFSQGKISSSSWEIWMGSIDIDMVSCAGFCHCLFCCLHCPCSLVEGAVQGRVYARPEAR
jgi:hypothetical protein